MTKHGDKRVRKRLGVPRKAVARLTIAASQGLPIEALKGDLKRYVQAKMREHPSANYRVWNGFIFSFGDDGSLITTFPVPPHLRLKR